MNRNDHLGFIAKMLKAYRGYACVAVLLIVGLMVLTSSPTLAGEDGHAAIEQTTCPVMVGNPIKTNLYTDYQGKRVYFCCAACVQAFEKEPKKYLSALPQFQKPHDEDIENDAEDEPAPAHNHATDHHDVPTIPSFGSKLVTFAGKLHPMATHFPIALVLAAALAEFLAILRKSAFFRSVARFNIIVGAIGAVGAALMGLAAGVSAEYSGDYARVFELHEAMGITVVLLAITAAVLSEVSFRTGKARLQYAYWTILGLAVAAVGLTGYVGGMLVYGLDHYAW